MTNSNEVYKRSRAATPAVQLPNRLVLLLSEARWLFFAVCCLYLILIFASFSKLDPGWSRAIEVAKFHNIGGRFGAYVADLAFFIFGFSAWWFCVALIRFVWNDYRRVAKSKLGQADDEPVHHLEKIIKLTGFGLILFGFMGLELIF